MDDSQTSRPSSIDASLKSVSSFAETENPSMSQSKPCETSLKTVMSGYESKSLNLFSMSTNETLPKPEMSGSKITNSSDEIKLKNETSNEKQSIPFSFNSKPSNELLTTKMDFFGNKLKPSFDEIKRYSLNFPSTSCNSSTIQTLQLNSILQTNKASDDAKYKTWIKTCLI